MPRKYTPLSCSKSDIIELQKLVDDPIDIRLSVRAQIILKCIAGMQVKDIATQLNERPNTVISWRRRFARDGVRGLLNLPRGNNVGKYNISAERIQEIIQLAPPQGEKRWTGTTLSAELGVPPDVIWRFLRKEKISLKGNPGNHESIDRGNNDVIALLEIPLQLSARKDDAMKKDSSNSNSSDLMDLVITARAIGKDGTIIEKEIRIDDALPSLKEFDLSTIDGFKHDFDQLERSVLSARNQAAEGLVKEYLEAASKKNTSKRKP